MVTLIDNVTNKLRDELDSEIKSGSRLAIAASCFSIYAFQELKDALERVEEFRFLFTSPTFISERADKEKREFYIPRLNRERSLYGDEFEVKLRNELNQKAIARECADWIKKKAKFRSNRSSDVFQNCICLDQKTYANINGFTTVDLGCERGNNIFMPSIKLEAPESLVYLQKFDDFWKDSKRVQDVTEEIVENIAAAYNENSPEFIYFVALYNIFNEFLEDISEDELPNEATGFKESVVWGMLYDFQRDAALGLINKLERYNGCILADSVGLGKTFTALAVIKYYEMRNKNVLVLCPKKLSQNWMTFRGNYRNNPLVEDRLRYDVVFHTDLSRTRGLSNGNDLELLNWENYDLVVIDESHNFRNGAALIGGENKRENRYLRLLNNVIRKGVKTKVLMLSATPVNNRFNDLKNQLALAYEGEAENLDSKLNLTRSITEIVRDAQGVFNQWSKLEVEQRTVERLLKMLSFDFFEVLDAVTIARSRKHIEKYYDTSQIGTFPERLKPISLSPSLTNLSAVYSFDAIFEKLTLLNLAVYSPTSYIHPTKRDKYTEIFNDEKFQRDFTQENRELGIQRLMAINLLKRLESSVYSFCLTLKRVQESIQGAIKLVDDFSLHRGGMVDFNSKSFGYNSNWDDDDENELDQFASEKHGKIELIDMDVASWRSDLQYDNEIIDDLLANIGRILPEHDLKLQELLRLISNKVESPINDGNKKVLVFTAFADTADYVYENVSRYVKERYGLECAVVSGTTDGKTTIPRLKGDFNTVLTCFSPISKNRASLNSSVQRDIDVLIATDCISEGQNLQDCDYLVNYDIHWNPVRIIQRFGRIDRIGSRNAKVQLVNFWPDVSLDEYIELRQRVETRMKAVNLTATGDDDVLTNEKRLELEYRKAQLKRLQNEVVDLEETSTGVSITDLGLNEFRLDLLEYIKKEPKIDQTPLGLHAVVPANDTAPKGVVYILKNRSDMIDKDKQNRLHPFYMVYVDEAGDVVVDHLSPKEILDKMRRLCKGRVEPIAELYRSFNAETRDGLNMKKYSNLLRDAIASIVETKKERDVASLFRPGGTTALTTTIRGLDDFELICFLVVR